MTGSFSPEECFTDERFDADAVRWACAFARHLEVERGLSSSTVRAYCIDIRSYLDWAARSDLDPLQVEYRRFRRYLVELNAAGYTPKTTSRRLSAIRTFFKYLNVQGVTQLNPAAATSSPKSGCDLPRKTPVRKWRPHRRNSASRARRRRLLRCERAALRQRIQGTHRPALPART